MKYPSKQTPITFTSNLLPLVISGTKDVTRRTKGLSEINKAPDDWNLSYCINPEKNPEFVFTNKHTKEEIRIASPYKATLYVRENYAFVAGKIVYQADHSFPQAIKWKPSMFMEKKYARVFLDRKHITAVRLLDITDSDAIREGIPKDSNYLHGDAKRLFLKLWDSINGHNSHKSNPWVWRIAFKVSKLTTPENAWHN